MISMMVHVLMLHSPRISLCDIHDVLMLHSPRISLCDSHDGTCINVTLPETF